MCPTGRDIIFTPQQRKRVPDPQPPAAHIGQGKYLPSEHGCGDVDPAAAVFGADDSISPLFQYPEYLGNKHVYVRNMLDHLIRQYYIECAVFKRQSFADVPLKKLDPILLRLILNC